MTTVRPLSSKVRHGQAACAGYGCKREECLLARRAAQKRSKYRRAVGQSGLVSSARAAEHLVRFRAAGVQDKDAIEMVGVARMTFYKILKGEQITRSVERRVLSAPVPGPVAVNLNRSAVNAVGTHRRLCALMTMGWPSRELERRLGQHEHWIAVSLKRSRVAAYVVPRVTALYDELWNQDPVKHGMSPSAVKSTLLWAKTMSWAPVGAWDDDTIDDPDATPVMDAPKPEQSTDSNAVARFLLGESVVLSDADRREVIAYLMEWTDQSPTRIAAGIGSTAAGVSRTWERIKKQAREEGRQVPWRRHFEPMTRSQLAKADMEQAA